MDEKDKEIQQLRRELAAFKARKEGKWIWNPDRMEMFSEPQNRHMKPLNKVPSAEKTGRWIDNETSYADGVQQTCTCSVCGIRSQRPLGDYCRWCGARMDLEGDIK